MEIKLIQMLDLKKTKSQIREKQERRSNQQESEQNLDAYNQNQYPHTSVKAYPNTELDKMSHLYSVKQNQQPKQQHLTKTKNVKGKRLRKRAETKKINNQNNKSNQEQDSEVWTDIEKRQKLPASLKRSLKQKAINSGHYRQRNAEVKKSNIIGDMLISKLKKQQFSCGICIGVIKQKDSVKLCDCSHTYCKNCLTQYVTYKIKMFQEVVCPEQDCDIVMSQTTDFYNSLQQETRNQYHKIHQFYMTSNDPTLKLCPKNDCDGIIKIVEGESRICGSCKRTFCPKCYFQAHEGECDQNQIDFLQNNLHYRQCGQCRAIIQRTEGCNHMTCKCKYQFCYVCGKKWTGHQHICNNNANTGPRPDVQPCCDCSCCEYTFGQPFATIFKFPIKVFMGIFFFVMIIVIGVNKIMLICFYLLISIIAGLFGFSFSVVCDRFDEDKSWLGCLLILFFPVAMIIGVGRSLRQLFCQLGALQCEEFGQLIIQGYQGIWAI